MKNDKIPAFSIIIPCYNVPEEYIRRALDSVARQTLKDYEIIIVDDGSKPEHHIFLEKLVPAYNGVSLITIQNNGVSNARNVGVKSAKGEYIVFLDADDIMLSNFLSEAYEALITTDSDFVIGGTRYVETIDCVPNVLTEKKPIYRLYRENEIRELFCYLGCLRQTLRFGDSYLGRGPHCRAVKRNIAERTPFHNELIIGEDLVWNLEILSRCRRVCIVESPWYLYWKNPDSATQRYNPEMKEQTRKAICSIESLLNLSDDREYLTFQYYIIDSIQTIRRSIFSYANSDNRDLIKKTKKSIYTEYPFTKLKDWRFFRLAPFKYKIIALFYRFRILLLYWDSRDK